MPNRNAYFGVAIDDCTFASLAATASALEHDAGTLLSSPEALRFDAQEALHMTFIFFGEALRELPAQELRDLHAAATSGALASTAGEIPLEFLHFELFPPGKMNQVAARFAPSGPLKELRQSLLSKLRREAPTLPSRFWSALEEEGEWLPHVTLGKLTGATSAQIGRLNCDRLAARAPTPVHPQGLLLLGEAPKRVWLDWDAMTFPGAIAVPAPAPADEARWKALGQSGMEALRKGKAELDPVQKRELLTAAVQALESAADMRPEFEKGQQALALAQKMLQAASAA